jgi:hypothetical protein
MKTLTSKNNVSIVFGEWFDRTYGNTYYDAFVRIDDKTFEVPYKYGYNHGNKQAIDEALAYCGYRVRTNKLNMRKPYSYISSVCKDKLKSELYK